jgi:hypothetical protein
MTLETLPAGDVTASPVSASVRAASALSELMRMQPSAWYVREWSAQPNSWYIYECETPSVSLTGGDAVIASTSRPDAQWFDEYLGHYEKLQADASVEAELIDAPGVDLTWEF